MNSRDSNERADRPFADIFPDDGVDPRTFFDRRQRHKRSSNKARMLSSQVATCLQLLFDGGLGDVDLQEASLRDVDPLPDSGTLRVTITVSRNADITRTRAALARAAGYLRSEVSRAINRRRTPELVFRVLPEGEL
jgi:ribosome-binding factor A